MNKKLEKYKQKMAQKGYEVEYHDPVTKEVYWPITHAHKALGLTYTQVYQPIKRYGLLKVKTKKLGNTLMVNIHELVRELNKDKD